jgi:hypothetical protein
VDECDAKQVSASSKRVYLDHAKFFFPLDGRSRSCSETKPCKGVQPSDKFVVNARSGRQVHRCGLKMQFTCKPQQHHSYGGNILFRYAHACQTSCPLHSLRFSHR